MELDRKWYALYTRPRFEKKIDKVLRHKGLKSYLPLVKKVRFWSDRKKQVDEPLFPSYVFVYAYPKERYMSLQIYGVVHIVSNCGEPSVIPDYQIESIRTMIDEGFEPEPYECVKGDMVEITRGPLTGVEGIIHEDRRRDRIMLVVNMDIGKSVAVDIQKGWVKKYRV